MYVTQTAYPRLRASLAPDYAELSDEQLDAIVAEVYGRAVTAEDVESFWSDIGRGFQNVANGLGQFAQQAAPVVSRALPSIAQGALTGASVGGPWGALAGALAGGAGSVLSQQRDPTLRGIGGAIGGVTQLAANFTGGGALSNLARVGLGALGGTGRDGGGLGNLAGAALGALQQRGGAAGVLGQVASAAAPQLAGALPGQGASANALMGLLSRPETVRALLSAAMGQFGRTAVPIGGQSVPVQSVMSAIGSLAGRAAREAEAAGTGESLPAYYYSADGELAIDPADADERADALLELYANSTPAGLRLREAADDEASDQPEYTDEDAFYDEWLMTTEGDWSEYDDEEQIHA
jgi:hypothetical protein